jgi:hypothetical protein
MNQNPFEDALDEAADSGESWGEGFDDDAFAEGEAEAFEEDALEDDAAGAEAFEDDSFDDAAFDDDSFDDEGDALDAAEDEYAADAADDLDEGEALDDADELDEGDEGDLLDESDEGDELEDAFADAMDSADEDEFARRLTSRMRARLRRAARPFLRRMAARAVPIGLQLIRHVSRMRMAGASRVDAMDAFADAAADEAVSRAQMNLYIPFLAGLAGRYVTRAILSASRRRARPGAARAIGRAATRATRRAARAIVRRHGPRAIRSVPRLVRQVVRVARQQPGAARSVPQMIRRAGTRVAASRPAAARLSRPSPAVRRTVARAGVTRRGPGGMRRRRPRTMGMRGGTIHVHGPVRIVTSRPPVTPRRPL